MATNQHKQEVLFGPKAKIKEAAIRIKGAACAKLLWDQVLTDTDRHLLGGDFRLAYKLYRTSAEIWMKARGVSVERAIVDVAYELQLMDGNIFRWLLRELGELHDNSEDTIQAAVASYDLVLVDRPRSAYWKGQQIDVDWVKRSRLWEFFFELCRHSKRGKAIDRMTFGDPKDVQFVAKQKSRLVNRQGFPTELGDRIKKVGTGTIQLDIPPQRIRLFEVASTE